MKVKELRAILETVDGDMHVVVHTSASSTFGSQAGQQLVARAFRHNGSRVKEDWMCSPYFVIVTATSPG